MDKKPEQDRRRVCKRSVEETEFKFADVMVGHAVSSEEGGSVLGYLCDVGLHVMLC